MIVWLLVTFFVCIALRFPIAFALGVSCLVALLVQGTPADRDADEDVLRH